MTLRLAHPEPHAEGDPFEDVTPTSLSAAKLAQKLDRMQVFVETGVRIDDEGHFILTRDDVQLGMQLGNFVAASLYGNRGEYRK